MIISHQGKVAFVTGAGSGIGRGIALRLGADGGTVAVIDIDVEAAEETLALLQAQGSSGLARVADVRERAQVQAAIDATVAQFGSLDLLVNNAGVVTMHSLADLSDEDWDFVVDVNLKGQFITAQLASRVMAPGSAMVNLATVESQVVVSSSGTCQPHYNASKGGVTMLTKALAVELAAKGIRVNAVAPGPINTRFTGGDITTPEALAFMRQRLLVPRVGEPEDIANAVSFLLSDAASFIDGIQLPVDGGWLTR
ncbi:MAG: SDR family NAD(P)-dependent oxidoreductase [Candidatus Nanopelagicales bacterium]